MKPLDPDTLNAVVEAAQSYGGDRLTGEGEACTPRPIDYTGSKPDMTTTGCGRLNRIVLPYEVDDLGMFKAEDMLKRGAGIAIACAEDDMMYLWPRLQKEPA